MAKFNEYPAKATPEDNDTLMIYDAAAKANKLSPFSGIWNWIVGKLTNAVIANLQTNNKTVLGAINELNSNRDLVVSKPHGTILKAIEDASGASFEFSYKIDGSDRTNISRLVFYKNGNIGIQSYYNDTWKTLLLLTR